MLARLHLQNFTVFADADFHFSPGLNVLVGTNGTGKSHVLKAGYAVWDGLPSIEVSNDHFLLPLFLCEDRDDLIRRGTKQAVVAGWRSEHGGEPVHIRIPAKPGAGSVRYSGLTSYRIFIPSKEVLSFYGGFVALYEKREVDFDSTYRALCLHLSTPLLREPAEAVGAPLTALAAAMGGTVKLEGERFVFVPTGSEKSVPINLYAEGLRKFGILWQLLRNGSLTSETPLFWDEPEANLNPQLLRKLARVLATLARNGFQIILATHSMFLLKELHILSREKDVAKLPIRYFGLNRPDDQPADPVTVTTVDDFADLPDIVALDEELEQSGQFLMALNDED